MPVEAQLSAVSGIIPHDFNRDGKMDVLISGNYHHREVETTRSDASVGLLLSGDGKGGFKTIPPYKSGFYAWQDARDMELLRTPNGDLVLVANNGAGVQVFEVK